MRVFLFDIDGTLILTGGAGKTAMIRALETLGIAEPAVVEMAGRTDRAILTDLFTHHGVADSAANYQQFLGAYIGLLPECLAQHQGRVLPGVQALLESLVGRDDVLIGLLTGNVQAGARIKLEHYGLFHHFSFGAFGDDHRDRDDVARSAIVELRARMNGAWQPDQVWVIGDTPLDIRCARAVGVKVASVATGSYTVSQLAAQCPDALFADLTHALGRLGE